MSVNPIFNGYSLQTDNIITERVEFRTRAKRAIESRSISRRMGKKMVNEELQEKVIQIAGVIIGASASDLSSRVDEFQLELSKVEKSLVIEGSRAYTATAERITIPDRSYTQSMCNFDIQFVVAEGFAKDNQLTANTLIPSGTLSSTISTTISGNVGNRPLFRVTLPPSPASGVSTISELMLSNASTGNVLTVSGVWNGGDVLAIDFDNFQITHEGSIVDFTGAMDLIEPGSNSFTVTVSGNNDGTNVCIEYNPRYF